MAITNLNDYIASVKQILTFKKISSMTTIAGQFFDGIAYGGDPGAGVLEGSNTANGVVPVSLNAGYPNINTFQASAKAYLTRAIFTNSVASNLMFADVLFKAGAYAYNANITLSSQPDYSGRIPNGNWNCTEIWLEAVTTFTGSQSINIGYINQDGVQKSTGVIATGVAPTVGRMFLVPFASGDCGVRKITSVTSSVSTAGTFNVLVLRPLINARIPYAYYSNEMEFTKTGMPEIFQTSALQLFVRPDSTAKGLEEVQFEIANK